MNYDILHIHFAPDFSVNDIWLYQRLDKTLVLETIDLTFQVNEADPIEEILILINDIFKLPEIPTLQFTLGGKTYFRAKFNLDLKLKNYIQIRGRTNFYYDNIKGYVKLLVYDC